MNDNHYAKRKRRSESFFGLHFDFHAGDECTEIGKNTTEEMIEEILLQAKPDYVQCDCKGHRGFSSYPTKAGHPAPGIVRDALRLWREVTARNGVALFMHYSGVWDTEALIHHPEWACVNAEGEREKDITSTFGPYAEELLIPQLKELCDVYGVDGVWLDGESWATKADYGETVLRQFRNETGITTIPYKPEDPFFFEFLEFCREGFRSYLRKYTDALHQHNSEFQIASNWAFSSFTPEPVCADVDFISGDYTPQNSINSARIEGRCMARQGKPWDLMAWSFSFKTDFRDYSTKTSDQLKQEAAVVLALGGGFQAYFLQKPDGSLVQWQVALMKEIAEFCRARQDFCHKAELAPQIALLYSGKAFYRKCTRLFSPWNGDLVPMQGVLNCLLESQNSVEVLMEHHLTGRMSEYPLIIIPEWEYLEETFRQEILSYVENGGNLIVIGVKACKMFEGELGVRFEGYPEDNANRWLEHNSWMACIRSSFQSVKACLDTGVIGKLYPTQENRGDWKPAATIANLGKGRIAGVYFDLGHRYYNAGVSVVRTFLKEIVNKLFPEPLVSVIGSQFVDVTVSRKAGKLMINIVNTSGVHANVGVCIYDEIPPVGFLKISVQMATPPAAVVLQPEGRMLPYTCEDGKVEIMLERLDIHNIIVMEP